MAKGLKPSLTLEELNASGVEPAGVLNAVDAPLALIELEGEDGRELWIGFNNFYVITRYNRSPLYAMAVHDLAQAIGAPTSLAEIGMPADGVGAAPVAEDSFEGADYEAPIDLDVPVGSGW